MGSLRRIGLQFSDGISLFPSSQEEVEEYVKLESLILAQNERWRQA
jgi:hypothetical protein